MMENACTSSELPEAWKTTFAKMRPIIPAVFQILPAVAMIIAGCFGQPGFGTPWWSGITFLISGICLLILVLKKQTVVWEKWTFIAMILSMLVAVLAVTLYSLEFALATLPHSPFPHHGLNSTQLIRHYKVNTAELVLVAFELGICAWSLHILQEARKRLVY
ncbi:uncharacterized protein LOC143820152 isoform X1 [Paroedura picta]|uniref:uncharacterized protein LOC143820152 isoform X1 n=1 Tax=Paroedura picta TaxID=143630 RepID=UPI0040578FE6